MQNSKASKMFDSQPLGHVICSNYIDYNLIILIFKGDVVDVSQLLGARAWLPPPKSTPMNTRIYGIGLLECTDMHKYTHV